MDNANTTPKPDSKAIAPSHIEVDGMMQRVIFYATFAGVPTGEGYRKEGTFTEAKLVFADGQHVTLTAILAQAKVTPITPGNPWSSVYDLEWMEDSDHGPIFRFDLDV